LKKQQLKQQTVADKAVTLTRSAEHSSSSRSHARGGRGRESEYESCERSSDDDTGAATSSEAGGSAEFQLDQDLPAANAARKSTGRRRARSGRRNTRGVESHSPPSAAAAVAARPATLSASHIPALESVRKRTPTSETLPAPEQGSQLSKRSKRAAANSNELIFESFDYIDDSSSEDCGDEDICTVDKSMPAACDDDGGDVAVLPAKPPGSSLLERAASVLETVQAFGKRSSK
jgi:hypothetical protein